MRATLVAAAFLGTLALSALPAAARGKPPARPRDDPQTEIARAHVGRAKTHFKLGEFEAAIVEFKEAYRLKPIPGLLFNIAQASRMLGRYPEAKRFYENYLRDQPDAPNGEEVLRQIQQLEELIAAGAVLPPSAADSAVAVEEPKPAAPAGPVQAAVEPAPAPPELPAEALQPTQVTAPTASELPALLVAAGALVLGVAGAVTYGMASAQWDSVTAAERPRAEVDRALQAADGLHGASLGLGVAAGVAAATACVLFVF